MSELALALALADLVVRGLVDVEVDEQATMRVWPGIVAADYLELEPLDPRD